MMNVHMVKKVLSLTYKSLKDLFAQDQFFGYGIETHWVRIFVKLENLKKKKIKD